MDGVTTHPKKRKRPTKKDAKAKEAAKSKDTVRHLDKLPNNWRPEHWIGEPMLPEHVLKLLNAKELGYPLFVARVPNGMNFVEKYPADLCFIRFNDIFDVFRMRMLHFTVVRLVALSLSSHIVKEGTSGIAILDPFYMRESIICNAGDQAFAIKQVEDFMLADIKKSGILISYFPEQVLHPLVVHPQHSHAIYLDSGRDNKKDYIHIKSVLIDALIGFASKTSPLKVQMKVRGGLALTHTTNFPCLKQSAEDNGMDAWYAILQMQEYIKYADDMLLPESLRNRDADDICRVQGRVPGVYDDREDCRRQVRRFRGNSYKGYPTRVEAEGRYARYLAGEMRDMRRMKTMAFVMMLIVTMVMFYVIVV
ncbi:hypothetical protein QYE76_024950 [Lolium multiflorum]|uniref:Ribonuclease H1 N-terminal domain-containing protein n=1 Tax=Lolium multiflorum TaxID=4521 RepID=A0AAD8RD38_LOLMU|nr:hypothetical protein QYE76_024950 [Lolium multiflorum]